MFRYSLRLKLRSDATFGRGDGVAGLVDQEVEHDPYGLPYLGGRTLKGLLVEECANILFALEKQGKQLLPWLKAAHQLFGKPGSTLEDSPILHVSHAVFPTDLRQVARSTVESEQQTAANILESLTAIRRQTAVNEATGAPERATLRSVRVVLRKTIFEAELTFARKPEPDERSLLAACTLALRRVGLERNRGRGRITATLHDDNGEDITASAFETLRKELEQ